MIHVGLVYIHIAVDLSLLEIPDLVFAIPLVPDGHGSARGGVTKVGEIDVEIGFADENADGRDSSVWNRRLRFTVVNLPVSIDVIFFGADFPSARVVSLDGYDLGSDLPGTLDVEVLLIEHVLNRPAVAGVLNPPLRGKVRICS